MLFGNNDNLNLHGLNDGNDKEDNDAQNDTSKQINLVNDNLFNNRIEDNFKPSGNGEKIISNSKNGKGNGDTSNHRISQTSNKDKNTTQKDSNINIINPLNGNNASQNQVNIPRINNIQKQVSSISDKENDKDIQINNMINFPGNAKNTSSNIIKGNKGNVDMNIEGINFCKNHVGKK